MKLSELVDYRESLEKTAPRDIEEITKKALGSSLYTIQAHPLQIFNKTLEAESKYHLVNDALYSYLDSVNEIKNHLQRLILEQEPVYLSESYKLYESMCNDSTEHILNRRLSMSDDIKKFIDGRIQMYSNWRHSGMIIRPGLESWIDIMVASDPLYVIDTSHALLTPAKERFNDRYSQRVRWNIVQETLDRELLNCVPDSQIGFCLCYNFFHFKPFEIMKKYLIEIFNKLKPGGTLAITFNDCDRRGAVENTERYYMCYTPGRMVQSLCDNVGFEIAHSFELDAAATWLELRKPGTLESLRGGQTLAKVTPKHT